MGNDGDFPKFCNPFKVTLHPIHADLASTSENGFGCFASTGVNFGRGFDRGAPEAWGCLQCAKNKLAQYSRAYPQRGLQKALFRNSRSAKIPWRELITYYILFFIEIGSRRVSQGGITRYPDSCWLEQVARNATMEGIGYLNRCRYLLHDRDTKISMSSGRRWLREA
jgi:hypothetical protein